MRLKDIDWNMHDSANKGPKDYSTIYVNVLMDIRDELKRINTRLDCHETLKIPRYLRRIATNTTKKRKKK